MTDRNLLLLAWILVAVELISPLPAFLTLGAIYVLIARPPWFPRIVERLYGDVGDGARPGR